jgi:hypothetical protein
MNKSEIKTSLLESHGQFISHLKALSDQDFSRSVNGKWSAGQQLDHIIKSVAPVKMAFSLPKILLTLVFGKSNRESTTYEGLVAKYQSKLANGGKAPIRFIPKPFDVADRSEHFKTLFSKVNFLSSLIDHYSEEQLDRHVLPHPLMGKITLREMLYFTIYHVGHHEKQIIHNLTFQHPAE